jgi:hypothetical protein
MGNGDLDGDVYWACWDPELIHSIKQIDPPKTSYVKQWLVNIDKDDIIKTICAVLCRDSLGNLCNLQLRKIDNLINDDKSVIDDEIVLTLAGLISHVVDLHKHGEALN